ncbi:MAG: hypothetical protein AAGE03_04505 [Pseudomonadota bacterium]
MKRPSPFRQIAIGDRRPMGDLAHLPLQQMPEMDGDPMARAAAIIASLLLVEVCHHHAARTLMGTDRPSAFHRIGAAMATAKIRAAVLGRLA